MTKVSAVIVSSPKDFANAGLLAKSIRARVDEIIISTAPGGAARGRNAGFARTTGDIIWFLDGDLAEVQGDLRAPARDPLSGYWVPKDWQCTPQADTPWTRSTLWAVRWATKPFGMLWGPCFAMRRPAFEKDGGMDPRAVWEDLDYAMHQIWVRRQFGIVPVVPVLGRPPIKPWLYLLKGDHAGGMGKDAPLNTANGITVVNP